MTAQEAFNLSVNKHIGNEFTITTVDEAESIHNKLIELRTDLIFNMGLIDIMPHYRGEQKYGWDITPGIFRTPLTITDPKIGKDLEQKAIHEFETVILKTIGKNALRDIFNKEKYGKDWDLLFQAQHAGIKTTLTDWSPTIISALYFATEESKDKSIEESDGQLWCFVVPIKNILGHKNYPTRKTFYDMNPFDIEGTFLINSAAYLNDIENRIFEYRMYKQKGRFIITSRDKCHIPLNKHDELNNFIFKYKIPAEFKKTIREELVLWNVTRKLMYIDDNPERQDLINEINKRVFYTT